MKEASMRKALFEGTCSTINSHPQAITFLLMKVGGMYQFNVLEGGGAITFLLIN